MLETLKKLQFRYLPSDISRHCFEVRNQFFFFFVIIDLILVLLLLLFLMLESSLSLVMLTCIDYVL